MQIKAEAYPSLMMKGADCKILIFWLDELVSFRPILDPRAMSLRVAAHHLAGFVQLTEQAPLFLSDAQALELRRRGNIWLLAVLDLRVQSQAMGQRLFKIRPKCHNFQCRILGRLLHGSRINPRAMTCFHDESFVGCISRLACMTHARSVGEATLYRYMALVFGRWLRPCN